MYLRLVLALSVALVIPAQAADSVFVEGAFNGSWGASSPPIYSANHWPH